MSEDDSYDPMDSGVTWTPIVEPDASRFRAALESIARLPQQTNMRCAADAANTAIEIARTALEGSRKENT